MSPPRAPPLDQGARGALRRDAGAAATRPTPVASRAGSTLASTQHAPRQASRSFAATQRGYREGLSAQPLHYQSKLYLSFSSRRANQFLIRRRLRSSSNLVTQEVLITTLPPQWRGTPTVHRPLRTRLWRDTTFVSAWARTLLYTMDSLSRQRASARVRPASHRRSRLMPRPSWGTRWLRT